MLQYDLLAAWATDGVSYIVSTSECHIIPELYTVMRVQFLLDCTISWLAANIKSIGWPRFSTTIAISLHAILPFLLSRGGDLAGALLGCCRAVMLVCCEALARRPDRMCDEPLRSHSAIVIVMTCCRKIDWTPVENVSHCRCSGSISSTPFLILDTG